MTEDELDLLASAYLDGEATSEEVALVERDPQLLARVEALRGVAERLSAPVAVPRAIKEQQLAAALSAFEFDGSFAARYGAEAEPTLESASAQVAESNVIDLTSRSTRSMPSWLPAAAALLLLGGGGAWVISQASGGDSDSTASESAADLISDQDAGDTQARAAQAAGDEEATEAMELSENDAVADDEAMDGDSDSAADSAAAEESVEEEAEPAAAPAEDAGDAEGEEGGFFPREPVLSFTSVPTLDDLPEEFSQELRVEVTTSLCGDSLTLADGQSISGYLPIEVGGQLAELFIVVDEAGEQTIVVVNNDGCQLNQ
jgi:hypothetical protein